MIKVGQNIEYSYAFTLLISTCVRNPTLSAGRFSRLRNYK